MATEARAQTGQFISSSHVLQRIGVHLAQIAISPVLLTMRLVLVRNSLYRDPKKLDLKGYGDSATYILYGNHQSGLDPLIICASLPLKTIRHLMPFRFFVENSYFKGPMKAFLNIMGGFPAHYHPKRPYGLSKARSLMSKKQTIVIFPPAMRTRKKVAKPGVSVLAAEPDTYLIPVHIDWKHRWHCHVYVGEPFKGSGDYSPEHLMELVYSLPLNRPAEI